MKWTMRDGRSVPTDEVFEAWTSGNSERMLQALDLPAHPVDRHFLLLNLCERAYALRKRNPEMRELARWIGREHVREFPNLREPLCREMGGVLPRVPTFQHLAILLTESGEYDEAIAVCEAAIRHGLSDGTKGGFIARIERIRKKAAVGGGT